LAYIGLTGNPGSGKSSALADFAELGWLALDADRLCGEVYEENDEGICGRLRDRWGATALGPDGRPDRRRIADIVFADVAERRWLEAQVHPLVRRRARDQAADAPTPVIVAVPLLFEAGWQEDFTAVATVWTREDIRWRRLRQRGWNDKEIQRRDAAQWPAERKLADADLGLINNGRRDGLRRQCRLLARQLTGGTST
jgi:dephospho-CoA kinase